MSRPNSALFLSAILSRHSDDTSSCFASRTELSKAIGYAKFHSRSHDAVIRAYDDAGKCDREGRSTDDFKEW